MKIKVLGTNSRSKIAHPRQSFDSLTPPPPGYELKQSMSWFLYQSTSC